MEMHRAFDLCLYDLTPDPTPLRQEKGEILYIGTRYGNRGSGQ
jgi:hypothetical protein